MSLPVATGTWPRAAFGLQVSLQTPCCLLSLISAGRGLWEFGCCWTQGDPLSQNPQVGEASPSSLLWAPWRGGK